MNEFMRAIKAIAGILSIGVLAIGLLGASTANAVIIGFEGVITGSGTNDRLIPLLPYSEGDFTLVGSLELGDANGLFSPASGAANNGTVILGVGASSDGKALFSITHDFGSLFSLTSLEAASLEDTSASIRVEGFFGGGGSVATTLAATDTFTAFTLPSSFVNLSSVTIASLVFQGAIDNINLSLTPIPEPTALAIFGIGLLGLGVMRRRRKTA